MNLSKILLAASCAVVLVAPPVFAQHHGGGGGHSRVAASRGQARVASPRSAPGVRGVYIAPNGRAIARYSRVAPVRFFRPYYTFQPRLSLGFGVWAGYPFAYSYGYYAPFYYPDSYITPYGYPVTGYPAYPPAPLDAPPPSYPGAAYPADRQGQGQDSIGVQPSQEATGGLSFDITPNTAQLFVDGALAGTVGDFTPTTQPLGVAPGHHQIEVRAPGYHSLSFEVDIVAGQVIPYQGTLER